MISGGSRSFAKGGRAIIVSIKKISKMGMVCIIYGEISEGSGPKLPPWILVSLTKLQMWIPLYDTDGDSLMNSTN